MSSVINDRLKKQLDFMIEIDKVKEIIRMTYIASGKKHENDAEHSWHLAVMAFLFSEYIRLKYNNMSHILDYKNIDENLCKGKYVYLSSKIATYDCGEYLLYKPNDYHLNNIIQLTV